jgi:hypothetical protein
MIRDELVDRIGANAPPDSEKPNVVKCALRAVRANAPPAPATWLKPLGSYDRRERREYQVTRFG